MLRQTVILITGASGEIGHGLITRLTEEMESNPIITLDLNPLGKELTPLVRHQYIGSILDSQLLDRILAEFEIDFVFHLAALLSTRSEFAPATAHKVNVEGTMAMLEFAQRQGESHGRPVKFMYPSSIAAYGMPSLKAKAKAGKVKEDDFNHPTTIYGCNKLYCEQLGRYYARYYKQLAAVKLMGKVDFRCIRFPGLISAATLPSGGTSDFAPEILHAAAQGKPYACFVRPDTRIPFMAMPDSVEALLKLAAAPAEKLTQNVYNIGAFNPSAAEMRQRVLAEFPNAQITTKVDENRQHIVDSWPEDVDDSAARRDWGLAPRYDLETAFKDYLLPGIRKRYGRG
ncbi:MAG TPA: NAD-dependent epimerase/dehydratase family protein [Gemmataceae bacterium]|nr:NAD-dependent epimerase/dehydratase family protein [Gemmataceae bacterium]